MRVRDAQELGRLVRARRMELGLSQSELAARVGSTRQWLSRFEQATNDVSLTHALAVLHALDLSIEVPSPALPLRLTPHNARQPRTRYWRSRGCISTRDTLPPVRSTP